MSDESVFALRFRALRKKAGLTQEEIAGMLNLSYMTIRRWEAGKIIPRIDEIKNIAAILHVSESELLNGPASESWELKLVISKTGEVQEGGVVDMTSTVSSAALNVGDTAMAITLSASYPLWENDDEFEKLIEQLRKKREAGLKARREGW